MRARGGRWGGGGGGGVDCVSVHVWAKARMQSPSLMKRESSLKLSPSLSCSARLQPLVFLPRICATAKSILPDSLFFLFFFFVVSGMSPIVKSPECTPLLCHCKVACTNNTLSLMFGCKVSCGPARFDLEESWCLEGNSVWCSRKSLGFFITGTCDHHVALSLMLFAILE